MKKYNLYLAERQIRELEELSNSVGVSVSEIIRRGIDSFLEAEKDKVRNRNFSVRENDHESEYHT